MSPNALYYGDNLHVLREHIKDESVDLIYLDPPFNSQANYNVLFRGSTGERSKAQIEAFEDTWHWTDEAEKAFDDVMRCGNTDVSEMLRALRSFLKESDMMAYLTMMAVRLLELHRVLKPTGSIYLHCDPTASHYLKLLMDSVFLPVNFHSEIIWRRNNAHNKLSRQYGPIHDTILYFSKSDKAVFHPGFTPYAKAYLADAFKEVDEQGRRFQRNNLTGQGTRDGESGKPWRGYNPTSKGRHWAIPASLRQHIPAGLALHEQLEHLYQRGFILFPEKEDGQPRYKQFPGAGIPFQDLWAYHPYTEGLLEGTDAGIDQDVKWLDSEEEKLGYPTQKPVGLLQRIVQTSSDAGGLVLDPFCGCGTTIHAAQKLGRSWIGIDITHLAISLIEKRLNDAFPGIQFEVHGTPKDLDGARALSKQDKYQFQWWAVSLVDAVPYGGKKRGADSGIDGHIYFKPDGKTTEKAIVSVKGGDNVNVAMIRDLGHVVDREKAKMGLFITLAEPTGPMKTEAVKAGFYKPPYGQECPKIQILTIRELFEGKKPQIPLIDTSAFKSAQRESKEKQSALFGG